MSEIEVSWVIASERPKELAEFYAFVINGEIREGKNNQHFLIVDPTGLKIHIYRPSEKCTWQKMGHASSICMATKPSLDPLSEIEEWSSRLISNGATVVEGPRVESFGAESWIADPEGNYFLILAPLA